MIAGSIDPNLADDRVKGGLFGGGFPELGVLLKGFYRGL